MKTKIVSFYCENNISDGFYKRSADIMINKCEKLGIDYVIKEKKIGNDWEDICRYKPTFLLEMFDELKEPFLWLDVDNIIFSPPIEVDNLTCDFASTLAKNPDNIKYSIEHGLNPHGTFILFDHVHYISNTEEAKKLLTAWKTLCDINISKTADHGYLEFIITNLKSYNIQLKFDFLPSSYVHGPTIKISERNVNYK